MKLRNEEVIDSTLTNLYRMSKFDKGKNKMKRNTEANINKNSI